MEGDVQDAAHTVNNLLYFYPRPHMEGDSRRPTLQTP